MSAYLIALQGRGVPLWFDTPYAESMPLADEVLGGAHRWFEAPKAARWTYWEERACAIADRVFTSSEMDVSRLKKLVPGASYSILPCWVDADAVARDGAKTESSEPSDGSPARIALRMDPSNPRHRKTLKWFAREVFPRLQRAMGSATPRFELFGWDADSFTRGKVPRGNEGIYRGEATFGTWRELVHASHAAIFPVRLNAAPNSRYRAEIAEAMASGVPVIATGNALEGLPVQFGTDCRIAEEANAFASELLRIETDPLHRQRLSQAAERTARARYDWRASLPLLKNELERS